ncbi:MAG: hypothetical protein NT014_05465 [Candidatus Omnitrophica bacterium]|nr:hypothetical protein [Candidatus Omnitrophota bacterium]
MTSIIKLKIADIIIRLDSNFTREPLYKKMMDWRFKSFLYTGNTKPHIMIKVNIANKLPEVKNAETIFVTKHFYDDSENWRLMRKGKNFIYDSPLPAKQQIGFINNDFSRATVHLLPKKPMEEDNDGPYARLRRRQSRFIRVRNGYVWNISDIIYDFLQVLLINYFALRKQGIFIHAVGIKDKLNQGLLFTGKSGAGKSTTARLWYKHTKALILNDDRIILRKIKGRFFIYGCPWHGDFSDYLVSRIESAPIAKIFFIHHAPGNTVRKISSKEAFSLLYPNLFPTFWNEKCLTSILSYCEDFVRSVPCFSLGFKNNKKVINFVRKI